MGNKLKNRIEGNDISTNEFVIIKFLSILNWVHYVPKNSQQKRKTLELLHSQECSFKDIKLKSLILAQDERWRRA